jgi:hypothetical protein
MIDRRETILARLAVVIAGIDGVSNGRNRGDMSDDALPAIFLHDGIEAAEELAGLPRNAVAIDLVKLEPQIWIAATAPAETIGAVINGLRARLVPAVLADADLKSAVGSNGQIRYVGCAITTEGGESREGLMEIKFSFRYVLAVSELQS